MNSLKDNLHCNNNPQSIALAPRNLDQMTENNTRKFPPICLPYVKGLVEKIQKTCSPYDIKSIYRNGLTLQKYLSNKIQHDQE